MANRKILLTVAARGGSKGVVDKNIRELCGLPLIAHTLNQARRWGKADKIICSTDSDKISATAREFGAETPFVRPAELANDTAGKIAVLRHALKWAEENDGCQFDIVIDLDVTAPIRKISDIENALETFVKNSAKSVFSVTPGRKNPYFNIVEINNDGRAYLSKSMESGITARQCAPKAYDMNASIYVYERGYLLDEQTVGPVSDKSYPVIMDEISAFDIDTEMDFHFVEYVVSKGFATL